MLNEKCLNLRGVYTQDKLILFAVVDFVLNGVYCRSGCGCRVCG